MSDHDIVGREPELQRLRDFVDRAIQGHTSICLVHGEPGAGKTTLLRQFSELCLREQPELQMAYGECDAVGEAGDPYLPFREILQDLSGAPARGPEGEFASSQEETRLKKFFRFSAQTIVENGPDLVDIFIPGAALAAKLGERAARKLKWVSGSQEEFRSQSDPRPSEITQESIFEQYVQVLRALAARRPLMLIIDDLHWADSGSVGLLFHLARRLVSEPILIVGAYRDEDLRQVRGGDPHVLVPVLAELKRIHGDVGIDLSLDDPRAFVDAILDSRSNTLEQTFRDELAGHTGGNPLFVTELLSTFLDNGTLAEQADGKLVQVRPIAWSDLPHRVEGVIESRMQRLSTTQREILDVASVQGGEFSAEIVAAMTGQAKRTVVRELSGSLQRTHRIVTAVGLVRIGSRSQSIYRFRHNLFQRYLYDSLDQIERAQLHAEAGAALEECHRGEEEKIAVTLARHFSMTPDWERHLHYVLQAAERARRAIAPREAVGYYEKALEIIAAEPGAEEVCDMRPARLAESLAAQRMLLAEHEQAILAYQMAVEMTAEEHHLRRSQLLTSLSVPLQRLSRYDEVYKCLDDAEAELDRIGSDRSKAYWQVRLEMLLQRGYTHYWRGDIARLEQLVADLPPLVEQWADAPQKCEFAASMLRLGLRQTRFRPTPETVALVERTAHELGEVSAQLRMNQLFQLGFAYLWSDRPAEAEATFRGCLEMYPRCGDEVLRLRALTYLGYALRRLDKVAPLAQCVSEAQALADRAGAAEYRGVVQAQRAWLAWRAGELTAAHEFLQSALEIWSTQAPKFPAKWVALLLRLRLSADKGDIDAAADQARELVTPPQARLPDELEAALRGFVLAADEDRPDDASSQLATALALAERLHFV